jgi:hypothetical protein
LDFSLLDTLTVKKRDNNIVATISNALDIAQDDNLNKNVARMFGAVLEDKNITNTAGLTGVVFGATRDPSEVIDTFKKVTFSLELNPLVAPIKKVIQDILNANPSTGAFKDVKLGVTKAELDVVDESTLSVAVGAKLENMPMELDIDLPYTFAGLKFNGKDYAGNTIQGLLVKNNVISTTALLSFPDNREAAQALMTIVGDIAFKRGGEPTDEITVYGAGFGYSKEVQTKLFSYISLNIKLAPYVKQVKEKLASSTGHGPLKMIDGSFEHEGIRAVAILEDLGIPFKMLARLESDVKWALNGERDPAKFLTMIRAVAQPFSLPSVALMMNAVKIEDTVQSLTESLVLATRWVDFADNARVGYVTLIGSNGKAFKRLDSAFFNGPPGIKLTNMIATDTRRKNETIPGNQFGEPIPFDMKIAFPNTTPLKFNCGELDVAAGVPKDKVTPDPDFTQLRLTSKGDFVIRSGSEITDMLSGFPVQGYLDGTVYGFRSLDFEGLIGAAVNMPDLIRTVVRTKKDGRYIEWFSGLMSAMEDSRFMGKVYENKEIVKQHLTYTSDIPMTE